MSIYDINLNNKEGKPVSLREFKDKVLLFVNIPAEGSSSQQKKLEKLYQKYKPQGLEILAIPTDEFKIKSFEDFENTFPQFQATKVRGEGQHDLYKHLVDEAPESQGQFYNLAKKAFITHGLDEGNATDILWNFEKFLVNKNGKVTARFGTEIHPDDARLIEAIDREICTTV